MKYKFSTQLETYIQHAGLSLRRVAKQTGIPHQTIFNWMKGSLPRWHAALPDDLQRLGATLGLNDDEESLLLRLAGCLPASSDFLYHQERSMDRALQIPKGWFVTGDAPDKYEIGVDPDVQHHGHPCVTIKSRPDPVEFAALAQMIKADAFHHKRVQFSAAIKTKEVENRAALFMRISGSNGKMLAFDNMRNRAIHGTTDWTNHAIVLDVQEEAETILFGVLLSMAGQVWMTDVHFEAVDYEVPTTDILSEIIQYFPINLGFEE
jgi:transcriptional regulator with XRE-family HTH domain